MGRTHTQMTLFNRVLSFFMAIILTLGLIPAFPFTASAATDDMPNTITLHSVKFGVQGTPLTHAEGQQYTSPHLRGSSGATTYIQNFEMNAGGVYRTGFCADHHKYLYNDNRSFSQTWTLTKKIPAGDITNYPYLVFLDFYYNKELEGGYSDQEMASVRTIAQAAIWLANQGDLTDPYNETQQGYVADERRAFFEANISGFDDGASDGWTSIRIIKIIVDRWAGLKHFDYYLYTPGGSGIQPIIIPKLTTPQTGDKEGWLSVSKVDQDGKPLAGVEFTVYDPELSRPVKTITTGADGVAFLHCEWNEEDIDSKTYLVKETKAPAGYIMAGGEYTVVVDANVNNTKDKAAKVNGGQPITNKTREPGELLSKVDQFGAGIGPATFKFEGQQADGGTYSGSFTCDESGILKAQWWDPSADNYIPAGEYTVTETIPPEGCEMDTKSQHLVLGIKEDGDPYSSGKLTFVNTRKTELILKKIDAKGDPLPGAKFDVYFNGKKVTSFVTGDDGTFTYRGTDGKGLATGYYEFVETEPPAGKLLPSNPRHGIYVDTATMHDTIYLTAPNYDSTEILIEKYERGTDKPLAGAVFEVEIDTVNLGTFKTDQNGRICIDYGVYGRFLGDAIANQDRIFLHNRSVPPTQVGNFFVLKNQNCRRHSPRQL